MISRKKRHSKGEIVNRGHYGNTGIFRHFWESREAAECWGR